MKNWERILQLEVAFMVVDNDILITKKLTSTWSFKLNFHKNIL